MAFKLYGTTYGGWMLNLDLVPEGSTVISAGIGEDISFDLELIRERKCEVVGIDPTPKSHRFIEKQKDLKNFEMINAALHSEDGTILEMYKNKRDDHVSESILPHHQSVKEYDSYYAETISLDTVFKRYSNVSVVKMDIEGSEYAVLSALDILPETVKQLCVEFHHFCTDKTLEDTEVIIDKIRTMGFIGRLEKPGSRRLTEITFWRT